MPTLTEGSLCFNFPEGWHVGKYDDWSFYRNQFSRMRNEIKALDILAVDPRKITWLIEVKDYRARPRTKPSDLADEIAHKVFDTLAAIIPAGINANDSEEKELARRVATCEKLRVILHLELPASPLNPRGSVQQNIALRMRRLLKSIDATAIVVAMADVRTLVWNVTDITAPP